MDGSEKASWFSTLAFSKRALPQKSLWRNRYAYLWKFMCPVCESHRRLPFGPRPDGLRSVGQVLLTSVFFTFVTWKWFRWKGMVTFVPLWIIFETFYRWRMRALLSCPHCGFDPYLFIIDPQWSKREIKIFWEKKLAEKGITPTFSP